MCFEEDVWVPFDTIESDPMPYTSFSHVSYLIIDTLWQFTICDTSTQLYCLLQVSFILRCPSEDEDPLMLKQEPEIR
jgi:hypothetical protein